MIDKYFDHAASDYDSAYGKANNVKSFIFEERKRIVLELFDLKSGRVLDLGCGPGVYTDKLCKAGYEIYGVDASERMIQIARSKGFKDVKFFVGSADSLSFTDNFFEGVLCVGVLEYLDDAGKAIKEIARVTKAGGIVIFTVPNASSLLNKTDFLLRWILKFIYWLFKIDIIKSNIDLDYASKLFFQKELRDILKRNGLKIEESRFHIFRISFLNKIFPKIALEVTKKMNFVSNPLLAINYIVRCRKIC